MVYVFIKEEDGIVNEEKWDNLFLWNAIKNTSNFSLSIGDRILIRNHYLENKLPYKTFLHITDINLIVGDNGRLDIVLKGERKIPDA